jgi:hypothetical protein
MGIPATGNDPAQGSAGGFKVTICDNRSGQNLKYLPHGFTQEGIAMLALVLRLPL